MKKFFSLTKKKKRSSGTPDSGSVLSGGYELKDKDLGKVHKAAAVGDVGKLKELAEKHDINQLDKENRTALHIACASGHVEVVHFLLERKARLNLCDNQNRSALMKAVQCQHERCVRLLLENHADPNLVDIDDNTALHLAANIPSISTAVLLLEHDANIDAQNKDGFTPLAVAVREDHIDMAEFLLREGADVNIVDKDQRSPLMITAGNGLISMLRLLLQFNAEVSLKDIKGWSADDHAVINGYHTCSLLISEHSIKRKKTQSPSLPGLSKKKKHSPVGSPSQKAGVAVCLGGPATSKYDSEDNSQSESQSRDNESVGDDWPSSEEDSLLSEAKPQKANLMKMLASKRKEAKSATEKAPRREDKSESQDESPEGEDSEEDEDRQEEEDDDDEEEDDDEDEDEEEEEEESDDEDEEAEENEEEGDESEDSDEGMLSIRADAASLDDVEKASVAGEKNPDIHISDNRNSRALSGEENCVEDLKTRTQQIPGASYAIPVTFDVEHDYVVSAVRVESKFSDDDESLGKESKWSTEHNNVSSTSLIGKTSTFPASAEEEINREAEKDRGSPRNKSQTSGVAVWTDSSDDGFGPNEQPADQTEEYGVEDNGSSDVKNDAGSHKWTRRSSQVSLSGQCSPGLPHYNKTAADAASDDSCWDSSSKSNGQNAHRPFLMNEEGSVVMANNPDSSDEAKSVVERRKEVRDTEGPITQSPAEHTPMSEEGHHDGEEMSSGEEEIKEVANQDDDGESQHGDGDGSVPEIPECERPKFGRASVLGKLESDKDRKLDLMEELGLSGVTDLDAHGADESDWDSDSASSRRSSPSKRTASPGLEDQNSSNSSAKEQDEGDVLDSPVASQRSTIANKTGKSSPPALRPQPAARKMVLQMKETAEGSSEPLASPIHGRINIASDNHQKKDNNCPLDTCEVGPSKPFPPGPLEPDSSQKCNIFKDEFKTEEMAEGLDNLPEKDCENLWVEVENKELKPSIRIVADHLSEKFEELLQPLSAEKEAAAESASVEDLSDEDVEAEARSIDNFSTPTQWESELQNSNDKLAYQDGLSVQDRPTSLKSWHQDSDQVAEEEQRASSSNYTREQEDVSRPGVSGLTKTHADINWKHNITNTDKTVRSQTNTTPNDLEEGTRSLPPLLNRNPTSVSRISDEELEEDVQRFKHEVGKLKAAFRDREKHPHLQKEVAKEVIDSAAEKQNHSSSWDSASMTEEQPHPTKSVPVHIQQEQSKPGNKEEKQTEMSPMAPNHRACQQNAHIEDPLSLYDDGSLDDISDEDGRLSANGRETHGLPEHAEVAEDLAELTHSSDSSIDDREPPLSEQTALFIQKLNSTLDSSIIIELQNIIYKYYHSIQKEKYRSANLVNKVSYLEMEKAELKSSLEEVKSDRTGLELNQLELQAEVRNLKLQLKQEHEDHCKATRESLRVVEEQQQLEVQERDKVEFTLRNLELENTKLVNNLKQLEEDYGEIQKLLAQERSARIQQENLFNNCLRKQQETEEENKQNISKSNEALTRLTEASSREREMLLQIATLQEQLTTSKRDLEHSRANGSLRECTLLEENRSLKDQLEDARRDLKANSESLKNTVFSSNHEVSSLKSELSETRTRLENERHTREKMETELESIRTRLSGAEKEAERSHVAKSERESTLLREKEEHQHLKGKLTGEVSILREENSSLSQKLIKAEAQANNLDNEVHRVTQQLKDKGLLQEVLQREKDQAVTRGLELEKTLHAEREQFSRDRARHEATQERLTQAQSEVMLLRQQLEEAQNKGLAKERAVTDAQGHLKDILSKLQSDYEERVQLVKERNRELDSKANDLQDHIHKLQDEKSEFKTSLRQAQQDLADSLKKLSMSEASLEVNTRYRNDLEEEKTRLFKDMDRLKRKLEETEQQCTHAERRIQTLTCNLDEKGKELNAAAQKLQESLSTSTAHETTIKQLEQDMQRLEIENARLEATANKQSKEINTLQKGTHEAALVKNHLEGLVAKLTLEDQLNKEVQKQSTQSHTAQDTQVLWEQELKSRTQLGLRLAELEKEKGELSSQMEAEKNKAVQLEEQKKATDIRLDLELTRNTELQKEMYRLRTLLKTAKKKLKDQDRSGPEFGSSGQINNKVDWMQLQLEQEVSLRRQLERVNEELKDQLASVKSTSYKKEQLDMRKQQLDGEAALYRRDAEERARQELQVKLDQVNLFLQSQAASQEVLEQKKASKEANLRFQLEQRIVELEGELRRARDSHRSTRTELERYQKLYTDELQLHKSLNDHLERTTYQLKESNATLLNERNKSFASSVLDLDSLGSLSYGDTKGPLSRGVSLGLPLLSPAAEGQSSRVGFFISKMQNELERSISSEIKNATAELESASARLSPVGSVSRADLHPVSMATQQYLEVLKKNSMI